LLTPYFDHDAFTHYALHLDPLDAPAGEWENGGRIGLKTITRAPDCPMGLELYRYHFLTIRPTKPIIVGMKLLIAVMIPIISNFLSY